MGLAAFRRARRTKAAREQQGATQLQAEKETSQESPKKPRNSRAKVQEGDTSASADE